MDTPLRWTRLCLQEIDQRSVKTREPSSLISLTRIKLSLIYDPRVCVINWNEWRQDATGVVLRANMTSPPPPPLALI